MNLRVSAIWEKSYRIMHTVPGSRSESKKRMTRYLEEHPAEQSPGYTQSSLTFITETGKQYLLSCLISYLPQNPLPIGHDYVTQSSNNAC